MKFIESLLGADWDNAKISDIILWLIGETDWYRAEFELHIFTSYRDKISQHYCRLNCVKTAVRVVSLFLNCSTLMELGGASLSVQATHWSFK